MEHKGEQQISFGRTMMQAFKLLWLVKGISQDKVTLTSEEIKPAAIATIKFCLCEGIR